VAEAGTLGFMLETNSKGGVLAEVLHSSPAYEIRVLVEGEVMDWGIDTEDLGPVVPGPGHEPSEPEDQEIPVDSRVWVKLTGPEEALSRVGGVRLLSRAADGSTIGEALMEVAGDSGSRLTAKAAVPFRDELDSDASEALDEAGYKPLKASPAHVGLDIEVLGAGGQSMAMKKGAAAGSLWIFRDETDNELGCYRNVRVKVKQVQNGNKEIVKQMLASPMYSLPADAAVYFKAVVPQKRVAGRQVKFKVNMMRPGDSQDDVMKEVIAEHVKTEAGNSTYKGKLPGTDKLRGEVEIIVALMAGSDVVAIGDAMYDSREACLFGGSWDRKVNVEAIFNAIANHKNSAGKKLSDENEYAFEIEPYITNAREYLTDPDPKKRKFDKADFSMEVIHGKPGSFHPDTEKKPHPLAFTSRDVKAGANDCEWGVFYSCQFFSKLRSGTGVTKHFGNFFQDGLHMAMGGITCMHSNKHFMVPKFQEQFVVPALRGDTAVRALWLNTVPMGPHGYGNAWWSGVTACTISPNLKYGDHGSNTDDVLPIGGLKPLSPDFRCTEDKDFLVDTRDKLDAQGKPIPEFPVTVTETTVAPDGEKFKLTVKATIKNVRIEHVCYEEDGVWKARVGFCLSASEYWCKKVKDANSKLGSVEWDETKEELRLTIEFSGRNNALDKSISGKELHLLIAGRPKEAPTNKYYGAAKITLPKFGE